MSRKFSVANLRANWYVPLSALVLFGMQEGPWWYSFVEMFMAFVAWLLFSAYVAPSDLWKTSSSSARGVKVFSWFTALGVCVFTHTFLYERMLSRPEMFSKLLGLVHMSADTFCYVLFAVSLSGSIVIYLWSNYFWGKFLRLMKSGGIYGGIKRSEIIFWLLLFALSVLFVTAIFVKTNIFYGEIAVYTGDTSSLVLRNSYLNFTHAENDERQALFALFSIPFIAVPYLMGRIIALFMGHRDFLTALFMNYAQIAMLIAGIYVLAKTMRLSPLHRIIFTLCFAFSYVYLLGVLMMEQYIVAFFWLSMCVYFVCNDPEPDRLILYGAGSTLTTSFIFTPFYLSGGGGYLRSLLRIILEFAALMFLFSRIGIILTFFSSVAFQLNFTGTHIPFIHRLAQYTHFLFSIFFSPDAGIHTDDFISWQLNSHESVNIIGIIIFIISLFSSFINRNSKICRISFIWVIFSFILLCVIGWGTAENGLILYSLYFSWAFYVLFFMLAIKAQELSGLKLIVPALLLISAFILVTESYPAIRELIEFGAKYYPYSW